jgi:hypothetical protein
LSNYGMAAGEEIMDRNRILGLALEELKLRKAGIDADIEAIQAELKGSGAAIRQTPSLPSAGTQRGRQRIPAERKAQAQRMREIWKKRKAASAAKPAAPAKKPVDVSARVGTMTDAQNKALSLAIKKAWKKRKRLL